MTAIKKLPCALIAVTLSLTTATAIAGTVQFEFQDGFFDNTSVAPLPSNAGTTLGEQRRILFMAAGQIWADIIDSPVPIVVEATFENLQCDNNGAVLGSAGATNNSTNFNLESGSVFFPGALADALLGQDQHVGESDISASFNARIDAGQCQGFNGFYYGLDNNTGPGETALFSTILHEIAHGLGFSAVIGPDGSLPTFGNGQEIPGVFDFFLFDVDDGELLLDLTVGERAASILDDPNLVWMGPNVTAGLAGFITGGVNAGSLRMYAPGTFEGGSSVSHFSTDVTPNLLMEPFLTPGLTPGDTDLTPRLLQDLGYSILTPPEGVIFISGFEDGE
ncbi:MAG: hypothetical protein AB8B96_13955 [Lysobacterales bacterium]